MRSTRRNIIWFAFACLLGFAYIARLQSIAADYVTLKPTAEKEQLETVTYNVEDLVLRSPTWRKWMDREIPDGIEGVVHAIATTVDPDCWAGKNAEYSIEVLNDKKMDIRATKKQHGQILDILANLRRLADRAVVLEAKLYEVDKGFYKKELEPTLNGGNTNVADPAASSLEQAVAAKLRKEGKILAENKVTILNEQASEFFSRRNAFTYRTKPETARADPAYGSGLQGISYRALVTVSADRRRVRMKITRNLTELIDIKKETAFDIHGEKEITVESPNLRDSSATATVDVDDGDYALVPVPYRPASLAKDRILVLLVQAVVYIEEEERERNKIVPPMSN
jgi:hypothetical protein